MIGLLLAICTLFASPTGNDANAGTTPTTPKTLQGAANVAQPGAVLCLLGGTYNRTGSFFPPRNGTPAAWITYQAYGDAPVNIVYTGSASNWTAMFHTGNNSFPNGRAYLEFNGFILDGRNNAVDGFYIEGSHHLRILNCTMKNFGGAGIAAMFSDYIVAERNLITHVGYGEGWTSGISLNSNRWFDGYAGFHSVLNANVISGSYDNSSHRTDGNGIILDLGGNTPPALIVNNVVYGNGGRGIQALGVSNFYIINNTSYSNGLDTVDFFGGLVSQDASGGYFVNNVSVPWNGRPAYAQYGSNPGVTYTANMYLGTNNFTNAGLMLGDPQFVSPPVFHPTATGQYATALAPWLLGDGLKLRSTSPARGRGVDPTTLPGLPAAISNDMRQYVYEDAVGNARPGGGPFTLGAYELLGAPSPPLKRPMNLRIVELLAALERRMSVLERRVAPLDKLCDEDDYYEAFFRLVREGCEKK